MALQPGQSYDTFSNGQHCGGESATAPNITGRLSLTAFRQGLNSGTMKKRKRFRLRVYLFLTQKITISSCSIL